jgi:prepilin-type N-terminal cleavage/methylation domain-containing protein
LFLFLIEFYNSLYARRIILNINCKRKYARRDISGFSLVELLIVIAIMGVLAVIAFNAFNGVLRNSKKRTDELQANNIAKAIRILIVETGYPDVVRAGTTPKLLYKKDSNGANSFPEINNDFRSSSNN